MQSWDTPDTDRGRCRGKPTLVQLHRDCASNTDGGEGERHTQLNSKSFAAAVSHCTCDRSVFPFVRMRMTLKLKMIKHLFIYRSLSGQVPNDVLRCMLILNLSLLIVFWSLSLFCLVSKSQQLEILLSSLYITRFYILFQLVGLFVDIIFFGPLPLFVFPLPEPNSWCLLLSGFIISWFGRSPHVILALGESYGRFW